MKAQAQPRRILPTRKRKETTYYPSDSESNASQVDGYASRDERGHKRKRAKVNATAPSTKRLPKKKIFPFTALPAELKNKIYYYALTSNPSIHLISKRRELYRHSAALGDTNSFGKDYRRGSYGHLDPNTNLKIEKPPLVPHILVLDRQIHAETLPILYGANVFAIEDMRALHTFLASIGPKNCAAIRQISIKHFGCSRAQRALIYPAFVALANAINLTRLELDCAISWRDARRAARAVWRDGHHWLEAIGRHKGRRDAALDIVDLKLTTLTYYNHAGADWSEATKREKLDEVTAEFHAELRKLLKAQNW